MPSLPVENFKEKPKRCGWTDNVKTVYPPPTTTNTGGYNRVIINHTELARFRQTGLDPDQTVPEGREGTVLLGSTPFAIPSASFGPISVR